MLERPESLRKEFVQKEIHKNNTITDTFCLLHNEWFSEDVFSVSLKHGTCTWVLTDS